jgi:hypothetical protein
VEFHLGSRRYLDREVEQSLPGPGKVGMRSSCLMLIEFLLVMVNKLQNWIVVMITQHCECT